MTPETSTTIIVAAVAVVGTEILKKLVGAFWRKASGTDYMTRKECDATHRLQASQNESQFVTRSACEECQRDAEDGLKGLRGEIKREMAVIRGILVALAVKNQIPESEWQKLVK